MKNYYYNQLLWTVILTESFYDRWQNFFFMLFIEKLGSEKMKTFFGGIMSLGVQIKSKAIIFS